MYCGIDLAAKEERPTGIAFVNKKRIGGIVYTDDDILDFIKEYSPKVVAIDAPLSLPKKGMLRDVERKLIAEGYRVFPIFGAVRELARRAIALKKKIESKFEIKVIEIHPKSSARFIEGITHSNPHIRDALLAAYTAKLFGEGGCRNVAQDFWLPTKVMRVKM